MSKRERQRTHPERTRNAVAVSLIWAGLASGAVVLDPSSAAASGPLITSDAARAAAAPAPLITDDAAGPAAASAAFASTALLTSAPVAIHGIAEDGSELTGTFELRRFQVRRGVFYAVGAVTGMLGAAPVSVHNVRIPVIGATNPTPGGPEGLQTVPTPGACSILSLDLGPLDLNLLGLRVALDPVVLLIEAVPGAGALLGNLLCAVAGLLDGGLGGVLGGLLGNLLTDIANLLNGLLVA
jgi:hypothetical protein